MSEKCISYGWFSGCHSKSSQTHCWTEMICVWAVLAEQCYQWVFLVHISRGMVTQLNAVHQRKYDKLKWSHSSGNSNKTKWRTQKQNWSCQAPKQPLLQSWTNSQDTCSFHLCFFVSYYPSINIYTFCPEEDTLVLALADHCHAYQGYVAVVPSVVVNQRGPIGHPCDLITVVPPRHYPGMLVCVLSQPVVGFPEVIQDIASAGKQSSFYSHQYKYWQGIDCIMINLGSQTKSFLYFPLPKRHSVPSLYSWA